MSVVCEIYFTAMKETLKILNIEYNTPRSSHGNILYMNVRHLWNLFHDLVIDAGLWNMIETLLWISCFMICPLSVDFISRTFNALYISATSIRTQHNSGCYGKFIHRYFRLSWKCKFIFNTWHSFFKCFIKMMYCAKECYDHGYFLGFNAL
jgi:hypothetical protein